MAKPLNRTNRLAIPIFMERVSPVLDTCARVLLVDLENKHEITRTVTAVPQDALSVRLDFFRMMNVRTIICGAASDTFHKMLQNAGMRIISGIAGRADDIVCAYCCGRLRLKKFQMPGAKGLK